MSFPIFSCPFSANPYKYEANEELPVVIATFMKNTDFMRVSGVPPVCKIGMQDTFGESGSAAALVEKYKLDAKGVYEQVRETQRLLTLLLWVPVCNRAGKSHLPYSRAGCVQQRC